MISVEFHNTVDDSLLKFAVILSRYQGKWLFCQHRDRDTYECPGGRREAGEKIEHTARRELYEETGAAVFTLTPLSAYSVRETAGDKDTPAVSYGMLYYSNITVLGPMPEGYEIARIDLFQELPVNWTYPDIQPFLLSYLKARLPEAGEGGANDF